MSQVLWSALLVGATVLGAFSMVSPVASAAEVPATPVKRLACQ